MCLRSLRPAAGEDLILKLQCSQTLVIHNLANVAPVEVEVRVTEVHEGDASDEEDKPRVVTLARGLERIVTELVTVRQVVHVVLLLERVAACVRREGMGVARADSSVKEKHR